MSFNPIHSVLTMKRTILATACCAATLLSGVSGAQAQSRVEVGTLVCRLAPTVGAFLGSRRRMTCEFFSHSEQRAGQYAGTITRFGVDVGALGSGILSWRVLARTNTVGRGSIAGSYFGASADASLGLGAGAKVLIGGSRRATMLQPVAWVGNIGINVAVGITGMTLRYSPR